MSTASDTTGTGTGHPELSADPSHEDDGSPTTRLPLERPQPHPQAEPATNHESPSGDVASSEKPNSTAAEVNQSPSHRDPEEYWLRLRGLPWQATEADITAFLGPDVHLAPCEQPIIFRLDFRGRPSGEVFIGVRDKSDFDTALKLDRQRMLHRYIEVFPSTRDESEHVELARKRRRQEEDDGPPGVSDPSASSHTSHVIRLRGLPYGASASDVVTFLENRADMAHVEAQTLQQERLRVPQHAVEVIRRPDGSATGEAFVGLQSAGEVTLALARHKAFIGARYIEVFESSMQEMQYAKSSQWGEGAGYGGLGAGRAGGMQAGPPTNAVRMRGLPYEAKDYDVLSFFEGISVVPGAIQFGYNPDGRPDGSCCVMLSTPRDKEAALRLHRQHMGSRYIELFPATPAELMRYWPQRFGQSLSGGYGGTQASYYGGFNQAQGYSQGYGQAQGYAPQPGMGAGYPYPPSQPTGSGYDQYQQGWNGPAASAAAGDSRDGAQPALTAPTRAMTQQPGMGVGMGMGGHGYGPSGGVQPPAFTMVRLRGLPWSASVADVMKFFEDGGFTVYTDDVTMHTDATGRPSGQANVRFRALDDARAAISVLNRRMMGSRYIELFLGGQ